MNVLFICKANVGRSQIAASFFNELSKKHHAISAGTRVENNEGQRLTESVVKCMAGLNYDLSKNIRKQLTLGLA